MNPKKEIGINLTITDCSNNVEVIILCLSYLIATVLFVNLRYLPAPIPTLRSDMTEKKTNSIQSPGWCCAHFKVSNKVSYKVSNKV